jgi:hypothetical protein
MFGRRMLSSYQSEKQSIYTMKTNYKQETSTLLNVKVTINYKKNWYDIAFRITRGLIADN